MIPSAAAPQNPNPNPNLTTNQSDFSTTLSSLKTIISLCHQTLQNPQFLLPNPRNDHFVQCPYNPHHLMPPESLFLHTLRCPFPLCIDPPNYQTTLNSPYSHHQKTNFTVQDFNEELCFSIDDRFSNSVSSSFFYQDCPAVVSLSDVDASSSIEEPFESRAECKEDKSVGETVHSKVIFVSQVAAAIAALHEQSWLGEKIRGLRVSQPLASYQRMAEHAYVSNRADEERNKRPNYRPIIEHDGLPRQRSSNQETNKNKTREELLAEERDYKRRRMSYRGKKVKRTTLQVMRDIIEGYMDEIKQAGGIGCFEKGDEEGGMFSSELSAHDLDADDHRKINSDSFEATRARDDPNYNRKRSLYDYDFKSTSVEDALPRDRKQSRQSLHGNREHLEVHRSSIDGEKHGGEYYSSSSERRRSHDQSHEWNYHQRGHEDVELTRTKHDETKRPSSSRSNYRDYRLSYSVSNSHQKTRRDRSTDPHVPNAFEDRYDPSESHDWYEDDVVNGNNYVRPE